MTFCCRVFSWCDPASLKAGQTSSGPGEKQQTNKNCIKTKNSNNDQKTFLLASQILQYVVEVCNAVEKKSMKHIWTWSKHDLKNKM